MLFKKTNNSDKEENVMNIGKNIASLRKKSGMTQEELAARLNVSAQAVSKWENESSCPDISLLPDIAKIFGVTVDALIGAEDIEAVETSVPVIANSESKARNEKQNSKVTLTVTRPDAKPVTVTLPMAIVRTGLHIGSACGLDKETSQKITDIVENEEIGEILSVDGENGEHITVKVE